MYYYVDDFSHQKWCQGSLPSHSICKLSYYVLNCPMLTHLELLNCFFKQPNSFVGFRHLINLRLERITFVRTKDFCVIHCLSWRSIPHYYCLITFGVLGQSWVYLSQSNHFMKCKAMRKFPYKIDKVLGCNPNPKRDEISTLEKLF